MSLEAMCLLLLPSRFLATGVILAFSPQTAPNGWSKKFNSHNLGIDLIWRTDFSLNGKKLSARQRNNKRLKTRIRIEINVLEFGENNEIDLENK